jgi:activator of HSP90 ATPase
MQSNTPYLDFKQYFIIPVEPAILFQALTHAPTIKLWSGADAVMEPTAETEFSIFDGDICGKNISFIPEKEIVQEWYFGEQDAPSVVTIRLHADKQKTSMEVRHSNIPEDAYENIADGWRENIAGALQDFYSEG